MDPYIGEIRLFASIYAPRGWALCAGQSLPIIGNEALFTLVGTTYGGDGRTTFNLPDLRGLLVCGTGQAPSSPITYTLGQSFGVAQVTVTEAQMPPHTHSITASTQPANALVPTGNVFAAPSSVPEYVNSGATGFVARNLAATALSSEGGSMPHANLMPTMAVNYIICIQGIFPA
ncbi:tail fiber protein [Sphingomonas sp. QA11]|uniref:phage tail protein n=1 Tax=Sphingomonas sp. QA11 TaxID=2950605 RepID=UPI002349A77C|nr:tail fiber protein [Sphingomonas sp. QA11]WCM28918.1 tail fiber protein [Sphingomonas sp. QA11]